jgi:hypothetical protein
VPARDQNISSDQRMPFKRLGLGWWLIRFELPATGAPQRDQLIPFGLHQAGIACRFAY